MKRYNQKGFTLIELLIVVAISGLVASTVIGFFISQQRSHTSQEQVTFMQQNMRAGLGIMSKELRMAGYDPTRVDFTVFTAPGLAQTTFSNDIDGDGDLTWVDPFDGVTKPDPNENITYTFDAATFELRRNGVVLAEGIEDVAFAYAFDDDEDGVIDANFAIVGANGNGTFGTDIWYLVDPTTGAVTPTAGPPITAIADRIRAVRIWLLTRTNNVDPNYTDSRNHYQEQAWPKWAADSKGAFNDNRRRRVLVTAVRCRNMGLL